MWAATDRGTIRKDELIMGANFSSTGSGEVALALALALKGEVPKCLPCALPGSTHLHSATRTSCETAGTGRIPNLIHQMEFLPPKSHTVLLGLTAHTKRLHADWYCPPLTAALDTVSNALP